MPDSEHEEWLRDRQAQKDAGTERLKRIAQKSSKPPKKEEDDEPKKKVVLDPVEVEEAE